MLRFVTIDDVIAQMYASMSFERGGAPDRETQREIFATNARLVRARHDGVFEFDPASFREDYERMIPNGGLTALFERELSRETGVFGDVAHVLSAYELRTSSGGELICRATKSIQLFQKDDRWRISAMIWQRDPA